MALRVLLADESLTIKKSLQLALQDFSVEVKNVPSGDDVLPVAEEFSPDIIFADILLAKVNGYEVSETIKKNPTLSQIPVVLMWSSFMEIDEEKFRLSRASGRLEKPFDRETLKALVQNLVIKTKGHNLGDFLDFPPMPTDALNKTETPVKKGRTQNSREAPSPSPFLKPQQTTKYTQQPDGNAFNQQLASWQDSGEEEPEEFVQKSVFQIENKKAPLPTSGQSLQEDENEDWEQHDISELAQKAQARSGVAAIKDAAFDEAFDVEIPDLSVSLDEAKLHQMELNEEFEKTPPLEPGTILDFEPEEVSVKAQPKSTNPQKNSFDVKQSGPVKLDANYLEELVRQQVKESVEEAVWRFVPEIAERVLREELNKLMREAEKNI